MRHESKMNGASLRTLTIVRSDILLGLSHLQMVAIYPGKMTLIGEHSKSNITSSMSNDAT